MNSNPSRPTAITFVCTGNICRSPTAEVVFRELTGQAGLGEAFVIDSAGMSGWETGNPIDPRAQVVLERHGVAGRDHIAREFGPQWLFERDMVLGMDIGHLRQLQRLAARMDHPRARLGLLGSFDPDTAPEDVDIDDPWYGDLSDFEQAYERIDAACRGLLDQVDDSRHSSVG